MEFPQVKHLPLYHTSASHLTVLTTLQQQCVFPSFVLDFARKNMKTFSQFLRESSRGQVGTTAHFENPLQYIQWFQGDLCLEMTVFQCELRKSG
jgi:hypothetical protein